MQRKALVLMGRVPNRQKSRYPPYLVDEIRTEVRHLASLHLAGPLGELSKIPFPKYFASSKVFEHCISLASHNELLGKRHLGAEGIQLRRTRCLPRSLKLS